MPFGSSAAEDAWIRNNTKSAHEQWKDKLATDPKLTTRTSNINSNGGVGNVPYGPPAPVSDGSWERAENIRFRTLSETQQRSTSSGGSGGGAGGGGGGGSSSPTVPYPYTVAVKNGISHGEVNEFLSKAVSNFNKANGTNFQLNSQGHIRAGGSGSYMSIDQQKAFNSTIPVNAVDYKYGKAIDKALAGNATDLKNLDRFFTGAERPAGGYSKEYLTKEKEARSLGITVAELDKRNAAKAAAAAKPKEAAPVASTSREQANEESDSQAAKKPEPNNEDKQSEKVFDNGGFGPNLPNEGVLPGSSSPSKSNEKDKIKEDKKVLGSEQGNSEDHRKDEEAKAKVVAAQAEAEEKKQQALAIATANKQSAKEERLKKIMEMRKPYMGGAASVNGSSDAMVVPPITPASQVPPPPLP